VTVTVTTNELAMGIVKKLAMSDLTSLASNGRDERGKAEGDERAHVDESLSEMLW
jgi:hypothetical protein